MKVFFSILFFAFLLPNVFAQDSNFVTSDIDNFWNTYDKIRATTDTTQQYEFINKLFIEKGSPGLKGLMEVRHYTDKSYIDAINKYPKFWNSIRGNTLKAKELAQSIENGVNKLKIIYPNLKPAKVYFTIGALRSGGTTQADKILIGSEVALGDKTTNTSEFGEDFNNLKAYFQNNSLENIVFQNIHEYVHTQQKTTILDNLLGQCVMEGIAEFVAVTATGGQPYSSIAFGKANDARVKAKFTVQMFNDDTGFWLYDSDKNEFGVRDLGYYVGYAIAERYYEKATDKNQSIREMIELDYRNEVELAKYVDKSGYFSKSVTNLRKQYEKSRPTVIGIKQFKNKSQKVNPNLTQITINFSAKMDTRFRNFDFGPLGENNLLRIQKVVGFSEDGKSITFEVGLKPAQHYQLVIGQGFRTIKGLHLKPYLIDVKTAEK